MNGESEFITSLAGAKIYDGSILAVMSKYCDRIRLAETVDSLIGGRAEISIGRQVKALVLNLFMTRSPLFRVNEAFAGEDIETLFGEAFDPARLDDNLLGRGLDTVFEFGPRKLFASVAAGAIEAFRLNCQTFHYDTTSISVQGEYAGCEDAPDGGSEMEGGVAPIRIVHGHSKDHRLDLKQLMVETLCIERNIPVLGGARDGNSSDKTLNTEILTTINKAVADSGEFASDAVFIADSAFVTKANLIAAGRLRFISRLPASYDECHRVIGESITSGIWIDLGAIRNGDPVELKNRPPAKYRIADTEVTLYEKKYRAVVVHSDHLDDRRTKTLERALKQSEADLAKRYSTYIGDYACEADAVTAAVNIRNLHSSLHQATAEVTSVEVKPVGRPRKNQGTEPARLKWIVSAGTTVIDAKYQRRKDEAGCFVLITAASKADMSAETVLREYKEQQGVERGFAFIKNPLIINSIFLKKPERIEALGFIFLSALLVWNLVERDLRAYITKNNTKLPGWDNKPTERPTTFMFATKFINIRIIHAAGHRLLLSPIPTQLKAFLVAIGLDESIFTDPGKKIPSTPPRK